MRIVGGQLACVCSARPWPACRVSASSQPCPSDTPVTPPDLRRVPGCPSLRRPPVMIHRTETPPTVQASRLEAIQKRGSWRLAPGPQILQRQAAAQQLRRTDLLAGAPVPGNGGSPGARGGPDGWGDGRDRDASRSGSGLMGGDACRAAHRHTCRSRGSNTGGGGNGGNRQNQRWRRPRMRLWLGCRRGRLHHIPEAERRSHSLALPRCAVGSG